MRKSLSTEAQQPTDEQAHGKLPYVFQLLLSKLEKYLADRAAKAQTQAQQERQRWLLQEYENARVSDSYREQMQKRATEYTGTVSRFHLRMNQRTKDWQFSHLEAPFQSLIQAVSLTDGKQLPELVSLLDRINKFEEFILTLTPTYIDFLEIRTVGSDWDSRISGDMLREIIRGRIKDNYLKRIFHLKAEVYGIISDTVQGPNAKEYYALMASELYIFADYEEGTIKRLGSVADYLRKGGLSEEAEALRNVVR